MILDGAITVYESDFGGGLPRTHPCAYAIRVHDIRKDVPGYANRGSRRAWERWFNDKLAKIYTDGGVPVYEVNLEQARSIGRFS